jgi:hypothetical protein
MFQIQNITTAPRQKQTLVLPDGNQILISMYFCPLQQGWFIPSISYRDFALTNLRIVNSPNMLYQYRNLIPFGLACFSTAQREPSLQEDFAVGNSKLYILTEAEVEEYVEILSGQIQS